MAVKSSGPLSFSEIQSELGGSNPISLSEYYKNGSIINNDIHDPNTIPNSGNPITVNDFYSCARRQFARWSGGNATNDSGNFRTHVFNNSGSFNRTQAPIGTNRDELHYIVIGGGGGGGTSFTSNDGEETYGIKFSSSFTIRGTANKLVTRKFNSDKDNRQAPYFLTTPGPPTIRERNTPYKNET